MSLPHIESSGKSMGGIPPIMLTLNSGLDKLPIPKIIAEHVEIVISIKISELDKFQSSGAWNRKIQIDRSSSDTSDDLYNFHKEQQAFYSMREQLKTEYPDKYVAIHGGHIVDSDINESVLIDRFYSKFGNVPVYIYKPEKKRLIKMPSPRLIR